MRNRSGKVCFSLLGAILWPVLLRSADIEEVQATGGFLVELKEGAADPVREGVVDDWELIPLETAAVTRSGGGSGRWWYLTPSSDEGALQHRAVQPEDSGSAWDRAYDKVKGSGADGTRGGEESRAPLQKRGIEPEQIAFIEPEFEYQRAGPAGGKVEGSTQPSPTTANAVAGSTPTRHWPRFGDVGAFQGDKFSQLKSAREMVEARLKANPQPLVRVAFLDTGYDPKHITCPKNINDTLARNFVEDEGKPEGVALKANPGPPGGQSHGTGVLGLLAGGVVQITGNDGQIVFSGVLGGAPMVEIIPMRVAKIVVHFDENPILSMRTSATTRAIHYAIDNKCDIISMSHGGLPSKALAEAVNRAYENGIAMFFASGDYFKLPTIGGLPAKTPRYVVFPAAFSRTMCVCGVTAESTTYGEPKSLNLDNGPVVSWMLRGNWGPRSWMKNAIAAFSPNVPWARQPTRKNKETRENVIDLDGQGTSASTPQAAAAGALWLQYHRADQELTKNWRKWQKAESVYAALGTTAVVTTANVTDKKKYSEKYFGRGILQAKSALGKRPQDLNLVEQKEARVGLGWIKLLASTLPIIRADPTTQTVLEEMLNLEIAQLVLLSPTAQEIIERSGSNVIAGEDEPPIAPDRTAFRREFFTALKNEPRCSRYLSQAITEALASP